MIFMKTTNEANWINKLISKKIERPFKMVFDISLFRKIRYLNDGLTVCRFNCDFDWYCGDHKPQFNFSIEVLNHSIIDLMIYNMYHDEDEDEDDE